MAASMAQARMALRLLQFSKQSRFLTSINYPRQCIGVLGQFRRHLADNSSKDGDITTKPGIELSHPKGKASQSVEASDSSSSSSSDSGSDSSDGTSSSESDSDGELAPEMVSAASDVGKALGGDADRTTSELLSQLRSHQNLTQDRKDSQVPRPEIGEMFKGMQIQRQRRRGMNRDGRNMSNQRQARRQQQPFEDGSPRQSQQGDSDGGIFAELTNKFQRQQRGPGESQEPGRTFRPRGGPQMELKLFDGEGLGIFKTSEAKTSVQVSTTESLFKRLQREDLEQQMLLPAENAFEEQIRWTHQGKLWTFPINNEQGMDEEAEVGFHEHIFLEPLIADFPRKGPIRHFMELVCVGLSKNPYCTVEEKRAHIDWFRNYFAEKKSILDEVLYDPDRVSAGENEAKPEL